MCLLVKTWLPIGLVEPYGRDMSGLQVDEGEVIRGGRERPLRGAEWPKGTEYAEAPFTVCF